MNSGFGFIINFLKMKKIEKMKNGLLKKRDELVDRIDAVRKSWIDAEKEIGDQDVIIQEKWNYLQTEFAITSEKIKTLEENRDMLIKKGAFSEALGALLGNEKYLKGRTDAPVPRECGKCGSENRDNFFYCNFCGQHFSENRPDMEGSLVETGELNRIYAALEQGVKETVSILALMKGLKEGLRVFIKSIRKVKKTEDTYSQLPTLKISVPEFSREFSAKLSGIEKAIDVKFYNLHPLNFAKQVRADTDKILIAEDIEKFFTGMGDELNKTTKAQWK